MKRGNRFYFVLVGLLSLLLVGCSGDTTAEANKKLVDSYKEKSNISLDAKDVQFDPANKLDEPFVISGVAKLSDYYNYGFTDEKKFFSVEVRAFEGKSSDRWHLYFDRDEDSALFNQLKSRDVAIVTSAMIPKTLYESDQSNMAIAASPVWSDSK